MRPSTPVIAAVDLFCGAGGLSDGLEQAGIKVMTGIDNDASCRYTFETNIGSPFIQSDVTDVSVEKLQSLWPSGSVRLLAGCAPCQPFSPYRRGQDTAHEDKWPLLRQFARLIDGTTPEVVTMENVPRIAKARVFVEFVEGLRERGYWVDWRSCYGPRYGLPQQRRRLVLLASRLGDIAVPSGHLDGDFVSVRSAIGHLANIDAGEADPDDPLHRSRSLSEINLERIRASKEGGTWEDWPLGLRAPCHQRSSGSSFRNVYARMAWDEPSPTITTLAHNYGAGRFGHPEQDRALSLREAALLQGFRQDYVFVQPTEPLYMTRIGRLIGNAVPPPIAKAVGVAVVEHVLDHHDRTAA